MNYEEILRQEKDNTDTIYLYPLQGRSGWVACEASAEFLHSLQPNISYIVKVISIGSIQYKIKEMIIDKLSLGSFLQKVGFVDEQTRLVITWER